MLLESITAAVLISGANYADYYTTRQALDKGYGTEANFIIGSQGQRLRPVKIAVVTLETGMFTYLYKRNRKHAWIWVGVVVSANLIVANHNRRLSYESKSNDKNS